MSMLLLFSAMAVSAVDFATSVPDATKVRSASADVRPFPFAERGCVDTQRYCHYAKGMRRENILPSILDRRKFSAAFHSGRCVFRRTRLGDTRNMGMGRDKAAMSGWAGTGRTENGPAADPLRRGKHDATPGHTGPHPLPRFLPYPNIFLLEVKCVGAVAGLEMDG